MREKGASSIFDDFIRLWHAPITELCSNGLWEGLCVRVRHETAALEIFSVLRRCEALYARVRSATASGRDYVLECAQKRPLSRLLVVCAAARDYTLGCAQKRPLEGIIP